MMRALIVVVVLAMLAPPAQADWLQPGHDAARTSNTPEHGPTWPDVAFALQLPVGATHGNLRPTEPLIVGDRAYIAGYLSGDAAPPMPFAQPTFAAGAIVEVNLTTAQPRTLATFAFQDDVSGAQTWSQVLAMVSDGQALYVLQAYGRVAKIDLTDGRVEAPAGEGMLFASHMGYSCANAHLALAGDVLYAACSDSGASVTDVALWAMDRNTLATLWRTQWHESAGDRLPTAASTAPGSFGPTYAEAGDHYMPMGLTVAGGQVIVAMMKTPAAYTFLENQAQAIGPPAMSRHAGLQPVYWAVHAEGSEAGGFAWLYGGATSQVWTDTPSPPENWAPAAVSNGASLFIESGDSIIERDLASGQLRRSVPFRPAYDGDAASGLAWASEGIYATSARGIHLFDTALNPMASWSLEAGNEWGHGAPARTGNGLLLARFGPDVPVYPAHAGSWGGLQALDARTLRPVWTHHNSASCTFAVSGGLIVQWCSDDMLQVLGTGPAALQPHAEVSSTYPAVGEQVVVDLSRTGPGARGPATQYRASWGDGAETEWQEDPVLRHKFTQTTDAFARVYMRNPANQTASVPLTFYVGQTDPAMNIFNAPFSDQYQETSFFLLGLLLTGLAALIGIYRAGRKRRLFERELRELEDAHTQLKDDPGACEPMLVERKGHARALFLAKKLDEVHASFLERRTDELRQGVRIGTAEERLKFLPFGMVQHLRRLLADGRVDAWERSHFLDALDREADLGEAQRRQVRRLIDAWFERDVGAG